MSGHLGGGGGGGGGQQHAAPNAAAGGSRLVSAMEHVDRVVAAFREDVGRAVAQVRAEVAAERDGALSLVAQAQEQVAGGDLHQLVLNTRELRAFAPRPVYSHNTRFRRLT